ncbi:1,2-phenylacetyl-CoA epoxidase subunit PaaD [Cognatishimia sp.]|uniref:1,2-phenylacetyl-CoA epoxidase subunit PaaD n=1 Tax=Cognatishimia sp. TaxID=2211648 RepID=UPI003517E6F9
MTRPNAISEAQVWDWLEAVPDPEIPVISVVDLGVIRDVTVDGDAVEIKITPTYSGCPAMSIISLDIETALAKVGVTNLTLKTQIAPPWTTDWLSQKGRARLQDYGIAPPQAAGGPDACPHCRSQNVEKISQFGSTPCKAQWRCKDCLEPFDYFKCI